MRKSMLVLGLAITVVMAMAAGVFAEEITITTYYPAPYGSYRELQLDPHTPSDIVCDNDHRGVMYYDSADNELKICRGATELWDSAGYWVLDAANGYLYPDDLTWKVGIGTIAPSSQLDIREPNEDAVVKVRTEAAAGANSEANLLLEVGVLSGVVGVHAGPAGAMPAPDVARMRIGSTTSIPLAIETNSTPKIWIESGGNVGIGTNAPAVDLEVFDAAGPNFYLSYANALWGPLGAHFSVTADELSIQHENNMGAANLGRTRMAITANDKVILGSGVPGSKLSVDGNVAIGGTYITSAAPSNGMIVEGPVGIGTATPQGALDVNGSIYQRGVVLLHADYVFEPDYNLETIEEHADQMWKNKRLKAIPESRVDENGKEMVEIGANTRGVVEELEKAHIYIEQLNKRIKELEVKVEQLQK